MPGRGALTEQGVMSHLPLYVSLPGPGMLPPSATTMAEGAFVRSSEDRFGLTWEQRWGCGAKEPYG